MGAVEDILDWSDTKCEPWRQDALRRLASQPSLGTTDHEEILTLVKDAVGFPLPEKPSPPVPLQKQHLASLSTGTPFRLKAIRNVKHVNRLVSDGLEFDAGLTIVYGRNRSGKSGFIRILRSACRTRVDNPAKLKVLADVYGSTPGPQEADIVIDINGAETVVPWTVGKPASEALLHAAVFDSSAAQFYVDGGNEIQFLPFGLALPHRLNDLCLTLKASLENERSALRQQFTLTGVTFALPRQTTAQLFYARLSHSTTDAQIDAATTFSLDNEERLIEVNRLLATGSAASADLLALAAFVERLAGSADKTAVDLSDARLAECSALKMDAVAARTAANTSAATLFGSEPLDGVGTDTWRRLWIAAREYSTELAYPDHDFPVVTVAHDPAHCVLCQQPLDVDGANRLKRFGDFITGTLALNAQRAEDQVSVASSAIPDLADFRSSEWQAHHEQLLSRDAGLAKSLAEFRATVEARHERLVEALARGAQPHDLLPFPTISPELRQLAIRLKAEAKVIEDALTSEQREKLVGERNELEDGKKISAERDRLLKRRDLLEEERLIDAADSQLATTGITRKANDLVDEHLTQTVLDRFKAECAGVEIGHLKVGLTRKSGQTRAVFQTESGTHLTRLASDILSEGEHRALALATFFTEVAVTASSGPIIIDDAVSSLDRQRGQKVSQRIVKEAAERQAIVFTHDLVFFNDLCRHAEDAGLKPNVIAVFSDGSNSGKIDPGGVVWKGLSVSKRLVQIRHEFRAVRRLHDTSPSTYEYQTKNLYGRLRDTYERVVEEYIFHGVIRRGADDIQTQQLRYVRLTDQLAIRFHQGMTKANTHSHDNPESETVTTPRPDEFDADVTFLDELVADLIKENTEAEASRPSMRPRK